VAMPSNMSPPGELICTVTACGPILLSAAAIRRRLTPPPIPSSPITSKMVMVLSLSVTEVTCAATGVSAQRTNASDGASAWNAAGRGKAGPAGRSRRLIGSSFACGRVRVVTRVPGRSRHVGRRIIDVAAGTWILVLERADLVGAPDPPLQTLHIGLPAGPDVALDEGCAVEPGIEQIIRADQVAVDCLLPHGQVILERIGYEADRLLLDAGAPAGGLLGVADHVRRHPEEHGDVAAAELAALDPLRILGGHRDAGVIHTFLEDEVLAFLVTAGAECLEPGLEIG